MARQSLSPMRNVDFADETGTEKTYERVGRKRKDAPMTHLKYLRKRCGYTLEALSEITSISISYLSRLESGTRRLNTDLIKRLSHAFNCTHAELLQESSHDGRVVTPVEFSRRKGGSGIASHRENSIPIFQIEKKEETGELVINTSATPVDWSRRPNELDDNSEVFAIKTDTHLLPHLSGSSIVYLEPSKNLLPESTVVVIENSGIMFKKIWSVTPTTLQLCSMTDIDDLKSGKASKDKLIELDRASLMGSTYKVVGYFCLS